MNISTYPERELLKIAADFKKHLKEKFPAMKSSSSGMDQGFIYKFKALFYEVQAHPYEPEADSVTYKYKLELDTLTEQAKDFFLILRFYLQKAFPYETDLSESLGYVEMEKVAKDHKELSLLLEKTVSLIQDKRSSLRAANCPDSTLEEIVCLSEKTKGVHDELQGYLQKKEIQNRSYQNNMKELFRLMEIIHEAASKSLQNDPESLKHLTFPPKEYIH